MVLKIPLDVAAENRLRERASRAGVDVAEFVRRLLEEATPDDPAAQFDAALDHLFSGDPQPLPSAASTYPRSEIYADGD